MAMSKGKDQVIKLFGKTIPLLDYDEVLSCRREVDNKQQDSRVDDPKTPTLDTESPQPKHYKTENDLNDIKNPQEKFDKIISCPRCNSKETKFCYYNNYNRRQPRHFCKNCQRYWTNGGTIRNIPVGAGRRKNKNPAIQYRHVSVSEGVGYDAHYPIIRPNRTLLALGSDMPLCEPMASFFLADKKIQNCSQHDQCKIYSDDENGENRPNVMQNCRICPPQLPFFSMPFYQQSPFWGYAVQTPWQTPSPSNSPSSSTLGKRFRDKILD